MGEYGSRWQLKSWGDFEKYQNNGFTAFNCPECGCQP